MIFWSTYSACCFGFLFGAWGFCWFWSQPCSRPLRMGVGSPNPSFCGAAAMPAALLSLLCSQLSKTWLSAEEHGPPTTKYFHLCVFWLLPQSSLNFIGGIKCCYSLGYLMRRGPLLCHGSCCSTSSWASEAHKRFLIYIYFFFCAACMVRLNEPGGGSGCFRCSLRLWS